jgi:hypothetical protein
MSMNSIRESLRTRREAAAARRDMERLLSSYNSPSDIDDILAAADRHDGPEAELMREILTDNLAAYWRREDLLRATGAHAA